MLYYKRVQSQCPNYCNRLSIPQSFRHTFYYCINMSSYSHTIYQIFHFYNHLNTPMYLDHNWHFYSSEDRFYYKTVRTVHTKYCNHLNTHQLFGYTYLPCKIQSSLNDKSFHIFSLCNRLNTRVNIYHILHLDKIWNMLSCKKVQSICLNCYILCYNTQYTDRSGYKNNFHYM